MTNRIVKYWEEEHGRGDEPREAPLWQFLRALPYLGACGIFPPCHLLNEVLRGGRAGGGMSPGAHWDPFEITQAEYDAVMPLILTPPEPSRFEWEVFQRDPELDQFSTYQEWMRAAAAKHGMEFGLRMAALQNEMMMRANKNLQ